MLGLEQLQVPYSSWCLGLALSELWLKLPLLPAWVPESSSSLSGCQPEACTSDTLSNASSATWVCIQAYDKGTKVTGTYVASSWLSSLGSPFWDALVAQSCLL